MCSIRIMHIMTSTAMFVCLDGHLCGRSKPRPFVAFQQNRVWHERPTRLELCCKLLTKALSMSLRMSLMMSALALRAMMASKECFWMDSSSLAGWPSLRTFALHCANLSTKLSTATLEGAQHRICTDVGRILSLVCNQS